MSNNTAVARVEEYLRQFNRLRDTGGTVHIVHTDPESEAVSLTVADLEAVLAQAKVEQEELTVYGYAMIGPTGNVVTTFDGPKSQQQAIDLAALWTEDAKNTDLDGMEYRVAAIVDQGGL